MQLECFLPQKKNEKEAMLSSIEDEVLNAGFHVIGARNVPYIYESCGPTAQKTMPGFVQVIIGKPSDIEAGREYEDTLYRLRRHLEKTFLLKNLQL